MLTRICSGGVVFFKDKVLILKNEKGEWVLPKGVIRPGRLAQEVAIERVKLEAGVNARIVSCVGETCYEFYSVTRQRPVCNQITWFLMEALSENCNPNVELNFSDGGFYPIEEALDMITYSQDKSLVRTSYKRYLEYCKEKEKNEDEKDEVIV
ncbi:NUDIX hydrolase [Tepidanaerobacter acetatoxydans Re1]|uniref:NUDIX hydrolase n=1 Tax=Tepidanaerobacter acetatoxydans (strain DSM 21804 / JCM 16047 / Re1) TaxID=1209989 RepID=F4LTB4_TEPAE|nr:NUDIX hydrolase [Tepidanaerobacter acetatoxydans]AEE90445.1 NUDIX hydrolase [Tepidanaerobacter acetatoxydans Re1]CDI40333.1 NUDIX hydrolase [Tepidanaerobacter acetatoxydans Re1]